MNVNVTLSDFSTEILVREGLEIEEVPAYIEKALVFYRGARTHAPGEALELVDLILERSGANNE